MATNQELDALVDALKARSQPQSDGFVSGKSLNALVMGIIAAVAALVWSNATTKPVRDAEVLSEIRTTVLEMRGTLTGINDRLENNTRNTSDLQSKVSALESKTSSTVDRVSRLEDEVRGSR